MIRSILLSLSIMIVFSYATASASTLSDQVRIAVYEGDIDQVERLTFENQRLFENGKRTAEEIRALFSIFTSSNPEVVGFVESWLQLHPDSSFARTAKAKILVEKSWDIRGELTIGETHPEALRFFRQLQSSAWRFAKAAHEDVPRLIPASEVLIAVASVRSNRRSIGLNVLEKVMVQDPNHGTLKRSLHLSSPGWGGSWELAEFICDTYAGMVPDPMPSPSMSCKIIAAMDVYRNTKKDWAFELLKKEEFRHLEHYRLHEILGGSYVPDEEGADIAFRILSTNSTSARMWHDVFDIRFANKFGYDFLSYDHFVRRTRQAKAELIHRPNDPELLVMLSYDIHGWRRNDAGHAEYALVHRPTKEEKLTYAKRLIRSRPYSPHSWEILQNVLEDVSNNTEFGASRPFEINRIVYSRHDPKQLHAFIQSRLREFETLTDVIGGKASQSVSEQYANVEYERDIICPLIRAKRLHEFRCEGQPGLQCKMSSTDVRNLNGMKEHAKKVGACIRENTVPPQFLQFEEVSINLDALTY